MNDNFVYEQNQLFLDNRKNGQTGPFMNDERTKWKKSERALLYLDLGLVDLYPYKYKGMSLTVINDVTSSTINHKGMLFKVVFLLLFLKFFP